MAQFLKTLAVVAVVVVVVAKLWPTSTESAPPVHRERVVHAEGSGDAQPFLSAGASLGHARVEAERAAKLDAFRAVIGKLRMLPLSNGQLVGDTATTKDVSDAGMSFRVVDTKYDSDGSVVVAVEVDVATIDDLVAPAYVVDSIW